MQATEITFSFPHLTQIKSNLDGALCSQRTAIIVQRWSTHGGDREERTIVLFEIHAIDATNVIN